MSGNIEPQGYSGADAMRQTAVGGPEPSEHQTARRAGSTSEQPSPSEAAYGRDGQEAGSADVGVTRPGSGTSTSGAGGRATDTDAPARDSGTMTQGVWDSAAPTAGEREEAPREGP